MSKKYLIFGATGSIGSSLANKLHEEKQDCHLIGRNAEETKKLADKEKKTPVIALCEKERPGFWIMVHSSDLYKLKKEK